MWVTGTAWAYGSSSSTKACAKPEFTDFAPVENAEVTVGSAFSFTASANTYPNSIKVTVKGSPSAITATPKSQGGFQVTGQLPATLKGVYARIVITAEGQSNCKGEGGWLLKITE